MAGVGPNRTGRRVLKSGLCLLFQIERHFWNVGGGLAQRILAVLPGPYAIFIIYDFPETGINLESGFIRVKWRFAGTLREWFEKILALFYFSTWVP